MLNSHMISSSELIAKIRTYHPNLNEALIQKAYIFSKNSHGNQKRHSGDPYFSHPVAVAEILIDLKLDQESIITALLHDVVEDTEVTSEEIEENFGEEIARLVDGVTKLGKIEAVSANERVMENFRKLTMAMSNDIRVLLVKLADRLHNMRTLFYVPSKEKKIRKAKESLDIFAPLAARIGLGKIKDELQELAFEIIDPESRNYINNKLNELREKNKNLIDQIILDLNRIFKEDGMECEVSGREKKLYSIFNKMKERNIGFHNLHDIMAFRVVTKDIGECYRALGVINSTHNMIPGTFRDYISTPKENGYQSLHLAILGPFNKKIEIQIRDKKMHEINELGVAAHWRYKEKSKKSADKAKSESEQYRWIRELITLFETSENSSEVIRSHKLSMHQNEVFCFTPNGDIFNLPVGSTVIDFAYAVHSDVGNCCVAAKYNQELVPLRAEVNNGDHIEIITAPLAKPNPAWLNFVITGKARSHIRQYLKSIESEESSRLGEGMLNQALKALHISPSSIKESHWKKLISDYGVKTKEDILAEIGLGKRMNVMVAHQLISFMDGVSHVKGKHKQLDVITIKGSESMAIQLATCCHPIPGDPILGFINKDKGLVVHTHDCLAIRKFKLDPDKWLDVEWDPNPDRLFKVNLQIMVLIERGMLAKISSVIAESDSNIDNVNVEESDGGHFVNVNFIVQVHNRIHLAELIRNLRKISNISRISRVKMKTS